MGAGQLTAAAVVAVLAVAHVVPPMLRFIRFTPRSWILSAAGGISVAYVLVHLLPEVAEAQEAVEDAAEGVLAGIERHAYLMMLGGLAAFYALERAAITSRRQDVGSHQGHTGQTSPGTFWLSVGSFSLYNAIIGYVAVRRAEGDGGTDVALFTVALAVHFLVNDLGLRHHHHRRYDRFGRPLLVAALVVGWLMGTVTELPEAAVGLAIAFLAGGVVLNVIKEELPEERESRFTAFAAGTAGYATLLLLA